MDGNSPICRNAGEIAAYIGINKGSIKHFRDEYGLPAWRFDEKGNWKALKCSLESWLSTMEKKHLGV